MVTEQFFSFLQEQESKMFQNSHIPDSTQSQRLSHNTRYNLLLQVTFICVLPDTKTPQAEEVM